MHSSRRKILNSAAIAGFPYSGEDDAEVVLGLHLVERLIREIVLVLDDLHVLVVIRRLGCWDMMRVVVVGVHPLRVAPAVVLYILVEFTAVDARLEVVSVGGDDHVLSYAFHARLDEVEVVCRRRVVRIALRSFVVSEDRNLCIWKKARIFICIATGWGGQDRVCYKTD